MRTTDGHSCSPLSVGLIPPGGGVVYINNYCLAAVHRFKRLENIHLGEEKQNKGRGEEEGGENERKYGASVHLQAPRHTAVTGTGRDGTGALPHVAL